MGKIFVPMFKIWAATIIIIAGILAVGFNSYQIMERNAIDAFNEQQLFLVREAARGLKELITTIEGKLRITATIIATSQGTDMTVERIFSSIESTQEDQIRFLFFATPDGEILYRYPPHSLHPSELEDTLKTLLSMNNNKKDTLISHIITTGRSSKLDLSFIIGVPINAHGGTISGWICCVPDFDAIKRKFIYPIRSGKTGYAWMVDNRAMLIAHPERNFEGKDAIEASRKGISGFSSQKLEEIVKQKMVLGMEGKDEYITAWNAEEKGVTKKLIAYTPISIHGIGWSIGISTPYQEVLEQLRESRRRLGIFIGSFIATIIVGALWLFWQERKNQQVNQYLQWSQEVFNGITDGITIVDRNYRVLMVNEAVCRWQNKPMEFLLGKPCHEVFLQREELCFGCPAKETFETGQPSFRERVSITLGGRKYYFHLYTFPLKDQNGKTVRVVEYVKDVTKERTLQLESFQNERLAIIGKMSAQVAHEIRNPLSALTLNVDLLEDEIKSYKTENTKEAHDFIDTIKLELKSLNQVINEYLQFTRLPKVRLEKGNVNKLIKDIFLFLEEELRANNIILKTNLDPGLPSVKIDYEQMRRGFLNIIRNAVEAMKKGGSLDVTTHATGKWIEITFTDTGEGIADVHLEQIFTPFFSTKASGTGLGLSITRHIIAEHGGEIFCESRPKEGTRFIINLQRWEE